MEHWLIVFAAVAVYLLPAIIAYRRGHSSRHAIAFINLFAGWTVLAWIICLIWSLANKGQSVTIINNVGK
jgi:hypothetical protein